MVIDMVWYANTHTILTLNKSDIKCQNTLGCLDQYTCRGLRLWNSLDYEVYGVVTLVTPKIHMYPGGYCPTPVTPRIHRVLLGHRIRIWSSLANTSVEITKNSVTSIEYESWDDMSWPHQILRRNYLKFVYWICDRDQLKARFLAQWNISNIICWYHNQNIMKWE